MDVLCIGNTCYDIIMYLDSFPAENLKLEITDLRESGGGPSSNAAYLLSCWGVSCGVACVVGNDIYGKRIIDEFISAGTDISLMEIFEGRPSSLSVILVNRQNGSRTIINRRPEIGSLRLDPVKLQRIQPKVLLFDGHELNASLEAIEAFPKSTTILDAGSMREGTCVLARKVDYVVCSEAFAMSVTGLKDVAACYEKCIERMKKEYPGRIVVTLGEKGLIYEENDKPLRMLAFKAETVDTTAAGDIFHGAFVYGILNQFSLKKTLLFSSLAASLSVTRPGGRQSTPSLQEVLSAFAKYRHED